LVIQKLIGKAKKQLEYNDMAGIPIHKLYDSFVVDRWTKKWNLVREHRNYVENLGV